MSNKPRSPWDLFLSGNASGAIEAYSRRFDDDGRPSHLFNRGIVRLEIGDYSAALKDFEAATDLHEPRFLASNLCLFRGVCHWYLDQPSLAIDDWRQSLTTPYSDAAGGVEGSAVLLYAAERVADAALVRQALKLLRRHTRRQLHDWPGAIVPYLLGSTDSSILFQAADIPRSEILKDRWRCQAEFYIAVRALHEGNRATFQSSMVQCAGHLRCRLEHERYLARWEVERSFPEPAF